jgi:hypothetical protein
MAVIERCECGEPFVSREHGWRTCARGHYERTPESLEVGALRHQLRGAVEALRELVDAGEPFIGDAFPSEEMTGNGLRLFNRWQAAMNDARTALGGQ